MGMEAAASGPASAISRSAATPGAALLILSGDRLQRPEERSLPARVGPVGVKLLWTFHSPALLHYTFSPKIRRQSPSRGVQ
jgi:hypothetical protein